MLRISAFALTLTAFAGCSVIAAEEELPVVDRPGDEIKKSGKDRDSGTIKPEGGGRLPDPGAQPPAELPEAGAPPSSYPFRELDIRHPLAADLFVTQCTPDGTTELVWKTTASGPDALSTYAEPAYTQNAGLLRGCGEAAAGEHPLVLASVGAGEIPVGTFLAKCVAPGQAHVYAISGVLDGHPIATWQYPEAHAACR